MAGRQSGCRMLPPVCCRGWLMLSLLACQNPDGGYPYVKGGPSWTEPTAYAVLALAGETRAVGPVARALAWLRGMQMSDGGWPPQVAVRQSTWVTAVVVLAGPTVVGAQAYRRGIGWILRQTGQDTNLWMRARQWLTGDAAGPDFAGWPWFPGTSAWVTPTALSMLALRQALRLEEASAIRARLESGASFLLAHAARDGGWNYGAPRALGYDARSYAETTGVALLALAGRDSPGIRKACRSARQQLATLQPSEGDSWLRLGLLAHGQLGEDGGIPAPAARTTQNAALALLASAARRGRNPLLE